MILRVNMTVSVCDPRALVALQFSVIVSEPVESQQLAEQLQKVKIHNTCTK